jgi:hypothetical protein
MGSPTYTIMTKRASFIGKLAVAVDKDVPALGLIGLGFIN